MDTHALLKSVISNDFALSDNEMFNDMKRRAVSLRQLT